MPIQCFPRFYCNNWVFRMLNAFAFKEGVNEVFAVWKESSLTTYWQAHTHTRTLTSLVTQQIYPERESNGMFNWNGAKSQYLLWNSFEQMHADWKSLANQQNKYVLHRWLYSMSCTKSAPKFNETNTIWLEFVESSNSNPHTHNHL